MVKILPLVLIAGFLSCSAYGYLTIEDFRNSILLKCYDRKDDKELINGQVSPIPSSLEAFVSIVERLEDRYSIERILRSLIAKFRFDDLLLQYERSVNEIDFVTRGDFDSKTAHEILQDLFGNMGNELRDSDLSEDEQCALYYMISHTVNDTQPPFPTTDESLETITIGNREVLKYPHEQGVVNLNGKTHHAFALGKVLLGILAGLQGSEKTAGAAEIYKSRKSPRNAPDYLTNVQINVLHGVTISDILSVTLKYKKGGQNGETIFLPNGYWDDSVCPTKYTLTDNNGCYATRSMIRGAIDGLFLGQKIKSIRENNQDVRLSQILRMYYNPRITSGDNSLSDITWCGRHSFFSSVQTEIVEEAISYYQLYASLLELNARDREAIKTQINEVISMISSDTSAMFDDVSGESGECGVSSGSKQCETPRDLTAVLYMKSNKELQHQVIGNLSVGFHMSPSGSSMAVYSNLRSMDGSKLHMINISDISGCASCAAKYYGVFDTMSTSEVNEVEVFRSLNRTLPRDDFRDENENEPGVPSRVVLYFNYGNPQNTYDLRKAVSDFRYQHSGAKIFAIGSKKESLGVFVDSPDHDAFTQDVGTIVKSLKERVCKVPALFQYENCYKNSRSDEDLHVFHGYVTPNHVQYWAMYPKYFLKSFNIKMTFTTVSGPIKVCFTRNYDEMYGTRQSNMKCLNAEGDKAAVFDESNPCKKYNVNNCRPFYFSIEALNVPQQKCTGKKCRSPNQIEFEFKHSGISCNRGISFAVTPMTLAVAVFMSIYFVFKH